MKVAQFFYILLNFIYFYTILNVLFSLRIVMSGLVLSTKEFAQLQKSFVWTRFAMHSNTYNARYLARNYNWVSLYKGFCQLVRPSDCILGISRISGHVKLKSLYTKKKLQQKRGAPFVVDPTQ